jgi:hypothetical protein
MAGSKIKLLDEIGNDVILEAVNGRVNINGGKVLTSNEITFAQSFFDASGAENIDQSWLISVSGSTGNEEITSIRVMAIRVGDIIHCSGRIIVEHIALTIPSDSTFQIDVKLPFLVSDGIYTNSNVYAGRGVANIEFRKDGADYPFWPGYAYIDNDDYPFVRAGFSDMLEMRGGGTGDPTRVRVDFSCAGRNK